MIINFKLFYKNEIFITTFIAGSGLSNTINNIINEKLFVFINKNDYKILPEDMANEIDNKSFDDFQGENPEMTLHDLLNKDIVYVKYNNKNEINEILDLRFNFIKNRNYAIISVENFVPEYK
jgi:hypothetical protein